MKDPEGYIACIKLHFSSHKQDGYDIVSGFNEFPFYCSGFEKADKVSVLSRKDYAAVRVITVPPI